MRDDPDYVTRRFRVHPSVKFAEILRSELADGTWAPGTVRRAGELARRFGTTPHVVNTTVQRLRDEGLVQTRSGGGGGISTCGTTPSQWQEATHREDIAEAVGRRISDGTYPVGEFLPSTASLAAEFGVVKSTVYLALRPLREQGLLASAGPDPRHRTVVTKRPPPDACPQPDADHADMDSSHLTALNGKGNCVPFTQSRWMQGMENWKPVPAPLAPHHASALWWSHSVARQIAATQGIEGWLAERIIPPMATELLTVGTWRYRSGEYQALHVVVDSAGPRGACHALLIDSNEKQLIRYGCPHPDRQCPAGLRPRLPGDTTLHSWRDVLRAAATLPVLVTRKALSEFAEVRGQKLTDESTILLYMEAARNLQQVRSVIDGLGVGNHRINDGSTTWKIRREQEEGRAPVVLAIRKVDTYFPPRVASAVRNIGRNG